MMKLYRVTTIVKEFEGCKDVTTNWFYTGKRAPQRPYADLIEQYCPGSDAYDESAIDELFTEDEAKLLAAYLECGGNAETTTIEEEKLPIPKGVAGFRAFADMYGFMVDPPAGLPFEVQGHFCLDGCQLIDGSGVYSEPDTLFCLVMKPNGEIRMQTNEEAAAIDAAIARVS